MKVNTETKIKGKILSGKVVSACNDKTVIVEVTSITRHKIYKKTIRRSSRFAAHVEEVKPKVGEQVRIQEIPPISKTKHYLVLEII